jgi:V/A-type H+-transporting ATPase subunit E
MGIEEVRQDIEKKIASELDAIDKEASVETDAVISSAEEKAKALREAAEREACQRSAELHKREMSAASLEAKKKLLAAKKEVLDDAWQKAAKKLAGLNEKERTEIIKALLKKGLNELDAKFVYSGERDKAIVKELAKDLTWVKLDCLGGIILENAGRDVRANYTFDVVLEEVKQATLRQLSKKLFGG